jgi:hypothetical protein
MQLPSTMRGFGRTAGLLSALAVMLSLSACDGPAADEQDAAGARAQQAAEAAAAPNPDAAVVAPPVGSCDASQVQGLVGQAFDPALVDQAKQDALAQQVRVLKPDTMTTMEFVGERLNLEVDEKNIISGVRCG